LFVWFRRLTINAPAATPVANPKAYIPIFTADGTSPQTIADARTATAKQISAIPMSVLFDFIFVLHFQFQCHCDWSDIVPEG
jgi:hypothetical protein